MRQTSLWVLGGIVMCAADAAHAQSAKPVKPPAKPVSASDQGLAAPA